MECNYTMHKPPVNSVRKLFVLIGALFIYCNAFTQNIISPDSLTTYKIGAIRYTGNKITKDRIIRRELVKRETDTLVLKTLPYILKRSEQNIFNTQLFIYDSIKATVHHDIKQIDLDVLVKERWYIWPIPLFEIQDRNLNTWWQTKDLFRINYGFALGFDNFSGNKDRMVIIARRGYSELYGCSYELPYLNAEQTLGFKIAYSYGRNNEITYRTEQNAPLFYRDYHQYVFANHEAKASLQYRQGLYLRHLLDFSYNNAVVSDTIAKLQTRYFGNGHRETEFVKAEYRYAYDERDNKQYPLRGWAFDMWLIKEGLSFNPDAAIDNLSITSSLKKHTALGGRFFLANQIKTRYMRPEKWNFFLNRGLGYNDNLRGYEYYVLDGQSYFYSKNSLRFQLVKTRFFKPHIIRKIKQFNTIPFYMFMNLHGDIGYVEDRFFQETNNLANNWQYGYGLGVDMISYYDVVLRIEYSVNRQMRGGIYIHLTSGF